MRGQGVREKQKRSHPLIAPVIAPLPAHSWASVRCVTASRLVAMNLQPGFSLMHSCGVQPSESWANRGGRQRERKRRHSVWDSQSDRDTHARTLSTRASLSEKTPRNIER